MILTEKPLFVVPNSNSKIFSAGYAGYEDYANVLLGMTSAEKDQAKLLLPPGEDMLNPSSLRLIHVANWIRNDPYRPPSSPSDGCYALYARLNHSCVPNCIGWSTPTGQHDALVPGASIVATRSIDTGDEIVISYHSNRLNTMTMRERSKLLRFTCTCQVCSGTASQRLCSDLRRRLLRGVIYLMQGHDEKHMTEQQPQLPLIVDPALKLRAERGEHKPSMSFVYAALMLAACLETPARRTIAAHAIAQSTAAECFFFAAVLYT